MTTERIGRSWDGRITRASKTLIAVKQRRVFECSLVNDKNDAWKPGLRPVEALERALLGYMDREAAKASADRCDDQFFVVKRAIACGGCLGTQRR